MKKSIIVFSLFFMVFAYFSALAPFSSMVRAGNFLDLDEQEGFADREIPGAYGESDEPTDIRYIVAQIIKAVLGLLAIIFLVLIIYAGFKWMTAGGNEDQAREARKYIMHAVLGLIIIMCAYAVTLFVMELMIKGADNFWIF